MTATVTTAPRATTTVARPGTAIYVRISRDREGAGLGVERQEADARELVDRLGLPAVAAVYADNDTSAYSGKPRPGYRALLDAIEAGEVSHLVAWHTDRLHRSPAELETFMDVIETAGTQVQTVKAGHLDLATPSGRMVARLLGATARYESEHKSERITRKHRELADAGKPHGGRRRFGYTGPLDADGKPTPGMDTVVESEAAVVREVADRLLAGHSLAAIARDLMAAGVTGTSGATMTPANMRSMMLRPHLAGLRVHRGAIVGEAAWDAILDRATWDAVHALLTEPSRRTTERTARQYVLTGMARCGVCQLPIRGRSQGTRSRNQPAYVCQSTGHVSRSVAGVDAVVTGAVAERLTMADTSGALVRPSTDDESDRLRARREVLAMNLSGLAVDAALGNISRDAMFAAQAAVDSELDAIDKRLADLAVGARQPQAVLGGLTGHSFENTVALWEGLTLDRKRAVLSALGAVVTLHPGRKGGVFDPDAVDIVWAE
jgi:site-specific DNA recombinase